MAALVARVALAIQGRPAFMSSDGWYYLGVARSRFPVAYSGIRPLGYPLFLRVLSFASSRLELITAIQHVMGILLGLAAYGILRKLGASRTAALAAAGILLLEGFAMTLEQFVLSETLFAELLLAALALTVLARGRSRVLALAGVLMAASACVRSAGIAAAAVWACYVAISNRRQWRALVAAGAGFVAPLVIYVGGVAASGHGVGVTTSDGWFLYARVAPVANCRGAAVPRATRPLCQPAPARAASPDFYLSNLESPALRLFPEGITPQNNALLRRFAFSIIRAHPSAYLRVVGNGFSSYFRPGRVPAEPGVAMPVRGHVDRAAATLSESAHTVQRRWVPGYHPAAVPPDSWLVTYMHWTRMPRLPLGIATALSLVFLALTPIARRRRVEPWPAAEVGLFLGVGLAVLLFSVSTSDFELRYLVPVEAALVIASALAIDTGIRRGRDLLHRPRERLTVAAPEKTLDSRVT